MKHDFSLNRLVLVIATSLMLALASAPAFTQENESTHLLRGTKFGRPGSPLSDRSQYSYPTDHIAGFCHGDLFKVDGNVCVCKATNKRFNPREESYQLEICRMTTQRKKECSDPSGYLSFVYPDRCFCKKTRQYLHSETEELLKDVSRFGPATDEAIRKAHVNGAMAYDWALQVIKAEFQENHQEFPFSNLFEFEKHKCIEASRAIEDHPSACKKPSEGLTETERKLSDLFNSLPAIVKDQTEGGRTVKITDRSEGAHGGKLLTVTRRVADDRSNQTVASYEDYRESKEALWNLIDTLGTSYVEQGWDSSADFPEVQGDPRKAPRALHPILAHYFGYEDQSEPEGKVQFPSTAEVNGAISDLNKKIADPDHRLNVGFYLAPKETKDLPVRKYLDSFAKRGELPVGNPDEDQHLFIHDSTFHVPGMLLTPPKLIKAAQRQITALLDFETYFKQHYSQESEKPEFKNLIYRIFMHRTAQLDVGSVTSFFQGDDDASYSKMEPGAQRSLNPLPVFHRALMGGLSFDISNQRRLDQRYISNMNPTSFSIADTIDSLKTYAQFLWKDQDQRLFARAVDQFLQTKKDDPTYKEKLPLTGESNERLHEVYRARRLELEQVVKSIEHSPTHPDADR